MQRSTVLTRLALAILLPLALLPGGEAEGLPLPAEHGEYVALVDADRHLAALAAWPPFIARVEASGLRRILAQEPGRIDLGTALLLARLRFWAAELPAQGVLSFPAAAYDEFGGIMRLFTCIALAEGVEGLPAAVRASELPRLQDELLATLRRLGLPRCRLRLVFRSARQAEALLAQAAMAVFGLGADWGLRAGADGSLVLATTVGGLLDAAGVEELTTRIWFASFGFIDALGDPRAVELVAALRAVPLAARLHREDAALVLDLGTPPAAAGALPAPGPGTVLVGRFAPRRMAGMLVSARAAIDALAGTALLAQARVRDAEDVLGSVERGMRLLAAAAESLDLQLAAGDGGLRLRLDRRSMPQCPALAAVPAAVPAGCAGYWLDATRNLGEALRDGVIAGEERLGLRATVAAIRGDVAEQRVLAAISAALAGPLAPLRRELLDHAPGRFSPGLALVLDAPLPLERAAYAEGDLCIDATGMQVPAVALVGACPDPAAVLAHWRGLLVDALGPQRAAVLVDASAELGVPALAFAPAALIGLRSGATLDLATPARLHLAALPGCLVLSDAPELTRRIARQLAAGPAPELAGLPETALARGRLPAAAGQELCGLLRAWCDRLPGLWRRVDEDGSQARRREAGMSGIGHGLGLFVDLAGLVADATLATDRVGDGWRTMVDLRPLPSAPAGDGGLLRRMLPLPPPPP